MHAGKLRDTQRASDIHQRHADEKRSSAGEKRLNRTRNKVKNRGRVDHSFTQSEGLSAGGVCQSEAPV